LGSGEANESEGGEEWKNVSLFLHQTPVNMHGFVFIQYKTEPSLSFSAFLRFRHRAREVQVVMEEETLEVEKGRWI